MFSQCQIDEEKKEKPLEYKDIRDMYLFILEQQKIS